MSAESTEFQSRMHCIVATLLLFGIINSGSEMSEFDIDNAINLAPNK